jgi:hypothetical protein
MFWRYSANSIKLCFLSDKLLLRGHIVFLLFDCCPQSRRYLTTHLTTLSTQVRLLAHDLRHTYTTNARKVGVHESVIMKLTGYKARSMFARYNSVDEAEAEQALNLMKGYFENKGQQITANLLQAQKRD